MILDDVQRMIHDRRCEIRGKTPDIVVYIEDDLWLDMMHELPQERLTALEFSLYETQGKAILGSKVYRVLAEGHGIKVFVDSMPWSKEVDEFNKQPTRVE